MLFSVVIVRVRCCLRKIKEGIQNDFKPDEGTMIEGGSQGYVASFEQSCRHTTDEWTLHPADS
jgi:hypothetical protein